MWLFCEGWVPTLFNQPCERFTLSTGTYYVEGLGSLENATCLDHPHDRVRLDWEEEDHRDRVDGALAVNHALCPYCGVWTTKDTFLEHLEGSDDCARTVLVDWYTEAEDHYGVSDEDAFHLMQRLDMEPPGWLLDIAEEEDWIHDPDEPYLDPPMEPIFDPAGQPTPAATVTGPSYVQLWG
jgi:hypothetical protein